MPKDGSEQNRRHNADRSWASLDRLKVGRFGEYFVKMAFVRAGYDVYSPEVDDRAIGLVLRVEADCVRYYEIQIKTVRLSSQSYVFTRKRHFRLDANRLLAVVTLIEEQEPVVYLLPATAWRDPVSPFSSRDFPGLKSEPEYGLLLSKGHLAKLEQYRFPGSEALPEPYPTTTPAAPKRANSNGPS